MPRVSTAERDRVIGVLKEESAQGRLSQETLLQRVEAALVAKDADQLAALLGDLPTRPGREGLASRSIARWSALTAHWQAAWQASRLPRLVLPRGRPVFTIGRCLDSDLPLSDPTVSWHHAELRQSGGDWVLVDVGSTNGTRANGWRVGDGFTVRAGDRVTFGHVSFRLTDRA